MVLATFIRRFFLVLTKRTGSEHWNLRTDILLLSALDHLEKKLLVRDTYRRYSPFCVYIVVFGGASRPSYQTGSALFSCYRHSISQKASMPAPTSLLGVRLRHIHIAAFFSFTVHSSCSASQLRLWSVSCISATPSTKLQTVP
jgi:hypothetical protein